MRKHIFILLCIIFQMFVFSCRNSPNGKAQLTTNLHQGRHLIMAVQQRGGVPKTIVVTNNSKKITAKNVRVELTEEYTETGVWQNADNCKTIPPKGSCQIIITPGFVEHSLDLRPDPENDIVVLKGDNTNEIKFEIILLDYGTYYEGGLVFSINPDATFIKVATEKVLALETTAAWKLPAIAPYLPRTAVNFYDGLLNTNAFTDFFDVGTFAAIMCENYSITQNLVSPCELDETSECYDGWYLPALCELAPGDPNGVSPINTFCQRNVDTIYNNLYLLGFGDINSKFQWSSTIDITTIDVQQYPKVFGVTFLPSGAGITKSEIFDSGSVRCARAIQL